MNKREKAEQELEEQIYQVLRHSITGQPHDEAVELRGEIVSDYITRMFHALPPLDEVTAILAYEAALNVAKVLEPEIGEKAAAFVKLLVQNSRVIMEDTPRPGKSRRRKRRT